MVNVYLNLSIFTVFLKNKNIIFKFRRSKVTDYAALSHGDPLYTLYITYCIHRLENQKIYLISVSED